MPIIRVIGNLGLSFINKISTDIGSCLIPQWFIAFKSNALKKLE